jgi:guanylate kinase
VNPARWRPIVLIGPAFVGKTTLVEHLAAKGGFRRIPTVTTRAPRPGESAGAREFVSQAEFEARCHGPQWIVTHHGSTWYAIDVGEVRAAARIGPVVFESSLEGVPGYRRALPELAVAYLKPADLGRLEEDLLGTSERPEVERAERAQANAEWATVEPLADLVFTVGRLELDELADFHRSATARLIALARDEVPSPT